MRNVLEKAPWVCVLVVAAIAAGPMTIGAQEAATVAPGPATGAAGPATGAAGPATGAAGPATGAPGPATGAPGPATGRKVTKRVVPIYPTLARKTALTGTVKMVAIVSPEGAVKSVRTIGGNAVLVSAAETAVKAWIFESAKDESAEVVAILFTSK